MKSLLYKEFKLAWHPICYVFTILFPLLILIPNYPAFAGLMLVTLNFTFLFMGVKKGKQSNDLLYTITLPVDKKQIVIVRWLSLLIIEATACVICCLFAPVAAIIKNQIGIEHEVGFDFAHVGNTIGFAIIGYCFVNALYLILFYRKGRSILLASLLSMLILTVWMVPFTIVLPLASPAYNSFLCGNWWTQIIVVLISTFIYVFANWLIVKKSIKNINKINF